MLDPGIVQLLAEDRRYPLEAYVFVFEALHYAQSVLGMGAEGTSEPAAGGHPAGGATDEEPVAAQHHVSGRELCEASRRYALDQYGYMAKLVLANWGIRSTGDLGEIVFNLIRIGRMRKTPADRREDFDDVFDFDTALRQAFQIRAKDEG
jgi:uncharacterized repeat protein (TIGR04138 family)